MTEATEASPAVAGQPAPETKTPASSQPAPAAPSAAVAPAAATTVVAPAAITAVVAPAATTAVVAPAATTAAVVQAATTAVVAPAGAGRGEGKRKRGRPRKYGPDGNLLRPLKATPISASVPDDAGGGRYTPASAVGAVMKRGRGRPVGFVSRAPSVALPVTAAAPTAAVVMSAPAPQTQFGALGELVACASGANFTPHIINVAAGEDVNMKVISFSQQGRGAICILSANGVVSNVTLRQPDSLGGTVTYEGRFELLSLSGSFTPTPTPTDSGGTRSRSGGMSVSLAAADGRVIGGGVAGLLVAAGPVQVVVGSFLPSYHPVDKKPVTEMTMMASQPPPVTVGFTIFSGDMEDSYDGGRRSATAARGNSMPAFHVENWTPPADEARKAPEANKVPVPGG